MACVLVGLYVQSDVLECTCSCAVCGLCVNVQLCSMRSAQTAEQWWWVGALQSSSLAFGYSVSNAGVITCHVCAIEHCVLARLQSTGVGLARCRVPLWLHFCNVMYSLLCLCVCMHMQCVEPRLHCRALVGGWQSCRAPLWLCVMC